MGRHMRAARLMVVLGLIFATFALAGGAGAAAGELDPSFGTGGEVRTDFGAGSYDWALGVGIQADGKLVAAGYSDADGWEFALSRYNLDGGLDGGFGSHGKVLTDFGATDSARAVAIQPDGKIVAVGYSGSGLYSFALARYNTDGSLDTSFGSGGQILTAFGSSYSVALAVAIQSDGKIVAAGYSNVNHTDDFALVRYNPDGSLDSSFGSGGRVLTDFGGHEDEAYAVALEPDGKIVVVGGRGSRTSGRYDFALARYEPDGSLDRSFSSDGKVVTEFGGKRDIARALALRPGGEVVAVGFTDASGNSDFALARYRRDGSLDPSFGSDGKVVTDFGGGSDDDASAVAIHPGGKLVVAGQTGVSGNSDFALARYKPDGSLDPSFGSGGKVVTEFGGSSDYALALAIQRDGKIVAAGTTSASGNYDFALARYRGSPRNAPRSVAAAPRH